MKKIIIIPILCLFYNFSFAQTTRTLNGTYSDGTFGKKLPDTVRTLYADSNITITSGGASLVDTIRCIGCGGGGGSTTLTSTYVGYGSGTNTVTGDANLIYSSTYHSLQVGGWITADTLYGSGASGGNLTLMSTSYGATKGKIIFGSASAYDQFNDRLGIGTTAPAFDIDVEKNTNGAARIFLKNSNTGTSASAIFNAQSAGGTHGFYMGQTGTGYATSGLLKANQTYLESVNSPILLYANGTGADSISFGFNAAVVGYVITATITPSGEHFYQDLTVDGTVTSPQLILTGVTPASPTDGMEWYQTTSSRLMFRQNATSVEIPGISAVSTVSPTAQNRTLTIQYNGTTYYITAKTTND